MACVGFVELICIRNKFQMVVHKKNPPQKRCGGYGQFMDDGRVVVVKRLEGISQSRRS